MTLSSHTVLFRKDSANSSLRGTLGFSLRERRKNRGHLTLLSPQEKLLSPGVLPSLCVPSRPVDIVGQDGSVFKAWKTTFCFRARQVFDRKSIHWVLPLFSFCLFPGWARARQSNFFYEDYPSGPPPSFHFQADILLVALSLPPFNWPGSL